MAGAAAVSHLTRFTLVSTDRPSQIDVVLHHPDFDSMTDLERLEVSFRALDIELGELAVMTRLGVIETSTDAPVAALPLTGTACSHHIVVATRGRAQDGHTRGPCLPTSC